MSYNLTLVVFAVAFKPNLDSPNNFLKVFPEKRCKNHISLNRWRQLSWELQNLLWCTVWVAIFDSFFVGYQFPKVENHCSKNPLVILYEFVSGTNLDCLSSRILTEVLTGQFHQRSMSSFDANILPPKEYTAKL